MSLTTHSKFYFGHTITGENQNLDFKEGTGAERTAILGIGTYTLTEFVAELQRALRAVQSALVFSVSVNRSTRIITIAATGNFQLLAATGSHVGTGVWVLAGFPAIDVSGAATFSGSSASGSVYSTQFIPQEFISSDSWQQATDGVVNKSASGRVEVVRFGTEKFLQMNLTYVTDRTVGGVVRTDASGVSKLKTLMQYLTTKARVEFMPDENDAATFESVILESTPDNKDGVGYKLKELYDKGLPGFYETGALKFRVVS